MAAIQMQSQKCFNQINLITTVFGHAHALHYINVVILLLPRHYKLFYLNCFIMMVSG